MTKSGTAPATSGPTLSEAARYVVAPEGIKSTGWPTVSETCLRLGWTFDPWQDGAGRLILAKRADGTYAADTTVISIPRQAGKTHLIACIIFALCLTQPGLTVIWTAHRKTTATETFAQFDGMAQRPKVKPHVPQVMRGKGDEKILFRNGSRILFGARESGFGRGFAGVDVLVLDEGQILTEATLEDMAATQNVAPNPLMFLMGTPPRPKDPGEYFTALREEAINGESTDTLYIETSADRGGAPLDPSRIRQGNPSYPHRTSHRAMCRLHKKLKSEDSWNREALGIWDDVPKHLPVVQSSEWRELFDVGPPDDEKPAGLAVDMSHDREISVHACWISDERAHGEEVWAGQDVELACQWIVQSAGRRIPVMIDSMSPAASMVPTLKRHGVKVQTGTAQDMAKACGLVFDELRAHRLTHAGQDRLNRSIAGARRRKIGNAGGWGWDRTDETVNIAPLVAFTLARYVAETHRKRKAAKGPRVAVL